MSLVLVAERFSREASGQVLPCLPPQLVDPPVLAPLATLCSPNTTFLKTSFCGLFVGWLSLLVGFGGYLGGGLGLRVWIGRVVEGSPFSKTCF